MKDIRRFLIRYNIHLFFREFVLLYPVYMLLFESKGLSDLDVSLLLIIWSVSVFILEVPSGIMADRWSRKNMIVLGTAFKVGGFVIWMFAGSFFAFALGFVFWGIQEAFCSGSTEALLFDTLKENGREDDYEKYAGRAGFFAGGGLAFSMLLGGFAASGGFFAASVLSAGSVAISALTAVFLKDAEKAETDAVSWRQYTAGLKDGLFQGGKNRAVLLPLLFCVLIVIVPGILEEYDQLYASRIGLSIGLVGIWGGARTGMESLGCFVAGSLKKAFGGVIGISVLAAVSGGLLFASVYLFSAYTLPLYALFYAVLSGCNVLAEGMLQREIESGHRAAVLSLKSLLMNLFGIVLYLCYGGISDARGMRAGFLTAAVYTIGASIVFIVMGLGARRKRQPF